MLAGTGDPSREGFEVLEELLVRVEAPHEVLHAPLVGLVGSEPARRPLALAQRLLEIELEPAGDDRPGADQGLPEEVLLVRVFHAAGERVPAAYPLVPFLVQCRERADARADVPCALRVVGLRGEERVRMAFE